MSFGFGVGDFLAVIEVATKIRKEFAGAPCQYRALSDEVKNLSVLIQDAEAETTGMDPVLARKVKNAMESSNGVLHDLHAFIEKNKGVSSKKSHLKRAWQRFSMDSQEVGDLRSRISSNILVLRAFTEMSMRDTLVKIEHKVESQDRRQERQRILDWISKEDYKHHRDIQSGLLHLRQAGTRQWLFGSPTWETWLNARGATLYCPGMPGAGKTVTTAMVIEKLQQLYTNKFALAYIFCEYQRENKSDLQNVFVRSTLRMLLDHVETVPKEITECYYKGRDVVADQMLTLLKTVAIHSRTTIIIDALDELDPEPRDKLLGQLSWLQREASVNVFLTSRQIPEIQNGVTACFPRLVTVEVKATEDDVLSYLDHSVKLLSNVVQKDVTLQEEIKIIIVKSTRGMFLLAHLHIISLRSKRTRKAIQQTLRQISEGSASYQEAYDNAMRRIQCQGEDDREIAMRTLLVTLLSRRPLSAAELCHFVAVDLRDREQGGVFDLEDVLDIEEILSTCAGLMSYQSETNKVQFVHQSTKEYLKETEARWFPDSEATMRDICETYNRTWEAAEATGCEDKVKYLLLDYARSHWVSHYLAADKSTTEEGPAPGFAGADVSQSSHGTEQAARYGLRRLGRELNGMGNTLQRASSSGQYALVELLMTADPTMKGSDAVDQALIAAVAGGHADLAILLLKNDANVQIRDNGLSLLAIAAQAGHLSMIQLLLEWDGGLVHSLIRDRDVPRSGTYSRVGEFKAGKVHGPGSLVDKVMLWMVSALSLAAYEGHVHIVRFLLRLVTNHPEIGDEASLSTIYQDAAICALRSGHWDAFQEILPLAGADMPIRPVFRKSSLFSLACHWDRKAFAELIFDSTATIGQDYFADAVCNGMPEVVRRLLPRTDTALLNLGDDLGLSPVHHAAYKGLTEVIRILVQRHDLDVNSRIMRRSSYLQLEFPVGRTPLHLAAEKGHAEVVSILQQRQDLHLNATDEERMKTPLIVAAEMGRTEVMQILLRQPQVLVDLIDAIGESALHKAAFITNTEAVRLLLEREDIHLDIRSQSLSPFAYAMYSTYVKIMDYTYQKDPCGYFMSHVQSPMKVIRLLYTAMKKKSIGTMDMATRTGAERLRRLLVRMYGIPDHSQPTTDPLNTLDLVLECLLEMADTSKLKIRSEYKVVPFDAASTESALSLGKRLSEEEFFEESHELSFSRGLSSHVTSRERWSKPYGFGFC